MVKFVRSEKHGQSSKKISKRASFALILVELCFALLIGRLFWIQCIDGDRLKSEAERYHQRTISVQPRRGAIYDRNHTPLAISTKSYSLFGDPTLIKEPESVALSLSSIIEQPKDDILNKLERDTRFVWLRRQLPDSKVDKVRLLNIKGISFREEGRRFYPQNELASHIIGFVGIDNIGLEGIEKRYDAYMRRITSEVSIKKDCKGRDIEPNNSSYNTPDPGYDLTLTLDSVIQSIVERELQLACDQWNAKGGSVIVMNPGTGEVLAMANCPTYDLNKASHVNSDCKRNRALIDLYEPGLTFEIVTASAAINENIAKNNDPANTAKELGNKKLSEYIKAFGLDEKTGVDTSETCGFIRNIGLSIDSLPHGQGISINALQMLSALNAIANDGVIMKPFIVKKVADGKEAILENLPCESKKPISAQTATIMKEMLQDAVENGSGQSAKVDGYTVAGKTGTSQKVSEDGKSYLPGKYTSSFVGFLPADKPVISIIVVIDEPEERYHGGIVASPVFKEIASQIMQYLTIGQGVCIAKNRPTS